MDKKEFVHSMRQEIREEGFMPAVKLAGLVVKRAIEFGVDVEWSEVMGMIPCDDIHTVEYTNSAVQDYRRKDLYYFCPRE